MINKIFSIVIVVLFIVAAGSLNRLKVVTKTANRLQDNIELLSNDNRSLEFKYSELNADYKKEVDSLSAELKVKPKQIVKYVDVHVTDTIRDTVYVELEKENDSTFTFNEVIDCFGITGSMSIIDSIPQLTFTELTYNNNITYTVYLDRKQWNLWFIKSKLFGKKEAKLHVDPECGEATVEEVELIKK